MNFNVSNGRLGWIAILALALVATSFQAKLGWYHPKLSHEYLVSKTFKVSECRLERAVPAPSMAVTQEAMSAEADLEQSPEPSFSDYSPTLLPAILISNLHFFRPPPTSL